MSAKTHLSPPTVLLTVKETSSVSCDQACGTQSASPMLTTQEASPGSHKPFNPEAAEPSFATEFETASQADREQLMREAAVSIVVTNKVSVAIDATMTGPHSLCGSLKVGRVMLRREENPMGMYCI
jgi:hypothetical protein